MQSCTHRVVLVAGVLPFLACTAGRAPSGLGSRGQVEHERVTMTEIINSIGMRMRFIPAGTFSMGSATGQPDEQPVHIVSLESFFIGVHEVTQEQYEAVMGTNPARFRGRARPVEAVSWNDASAFCRRLGEREGATYRLPTEAEWEYAARGGAVGKEFLWGPDPLPVLNGRKLANIADATFREAFAEATTEEPMVWGYDDGFATTAPVGSFAPNGYGLYDMIGNVFEWCADRYVLGTQYYAESPRVNPTGPDHGADRVLRGGSWWAAPVRHYRVAARFRASPASASPVVGFRCVRELGPFAVPLGEEKTRVEARR